MEERSDTLKKMNHIWIVAFLLIGLFIVDASYAKETEQPESWEEWEDIFINPEKKDWKLKKNKKGIKSYTRPVEISPIDSFKGQIEMDTDIQTLISIFMDIPGYASIIMLCSSLEVVKRVDEISQYLYGVNKVMWPVKPRDNSTFTQWYYDPETGAVTLRLLTKPDNVPLNKKYIRVQIMTGYFKFAPNPNGKVDVSFEAIVEVGGWVPAWIVNFYQKEIPYYTLRKLKKKITLEKYQGFFFDYKEKFIEAGSPS